MRQWLKIEMAIIILIGCWISRIIVIYASLDLFNFLGKEGGEIVESVENYYS